MSPLVQSTSPVIVDRQLEVLQKYYEHLGRVSDFDDDWKWEVKSKVEDCGRMSGSCEDPFLDKRIEKAEIVKCLIKLKDGW